MQLVRLAIILSTSTAGIISSSLVGVHHITKETIGQYIEDEALSTKSNPRLEDAWVKLKAKVDSLTEITDPELKRESFQNLDILKNWCTKVKSKTYKSFLISEQKNLLNKAKKVCILTIKEKLGEGNFYEITENTNNEEVFTKKLNDLISYNESPINSNNELISIKNKDKDSNNWKNLEKWCEKIYEKAFKSEEDNLWKLSERFCKK